MEEDNKPKLTLVASGGKETSPKQDSDKLTSRQENFAQGLSEGLTNSEAYRRAYNAEDMKPSTVHVEGCKLAKHPKVSRRVQELLSQKAARNSMLTERQTDRVWRNVWRLAEGAMVPPSVQQAALALAAKMAGMLTDKVEIENKSADSASIERELIERLQRLKTA